MSAESEDLKRVVGICEFCGSKSLQRHRYALFASTPAPKSEDTKLREFCKAYAHRKWTALHGFQDFAGTMNAALVYAIECPQCPNDKLLDMIFVRSPWELYDSNTGEDRIAAIEEDAVLIQTLVPDSEWKHF